MSQTNNFRHKCEYHSYIDAGKLVRGCAPVTHGFRLNIAGRLLLGSAKNCLLWAENIQSNNK